LQRPRAAATDSGVTRSLLAAAALLVVPSLHAGAILDAYGEIPPNANDTLGDTVGGLGSAISYDAKTGGVFMMPDRGAGDGTIDYRPRCYLLAIARDAKNSRRLDIAIKRTILFRDEAGRPFTGLNAGFSDSPRRDGRSCLDPEAICVAPDGTLYVSDEYMPALLQFARDGKLLRRIPLPVWYRPRDRKDRPAYKPGAKLVSGREENRGGEAMGILPDGKHAVIILQSALTQDGGKPAGTSRVLVLDLRTGAPVAEYAYAFGTPDDGLKFENLSVNDLSVVNDHTLLVLERDDRGRSGPLRHTPARYKSVWLVDTSRATNLLALRGRPYDQSPAAAAFKPLRRTAAVAFVKKTPLFNLPELTRQLGIAPPQLAAKWEGITLLPPRSKRTFHLLMSADNDFLNPTLHSAGVTRRFPRARDAVPTQIFEITATR
jgi:hypothetical protein